MRTFIVDIFDDADNYLSSVIMRRESAEAAEDDIMRDKTIAACHAREIERVGGKWVEKRA